MPTMMFRLGQYLSRESLWLILIGLAVSELGLPFPETVFEVTAGVVSGRRGLPIEVPILSCCAAVFAGDLALFCLARSLGSGALQRWPLRWLLPERIYPRIDALLVRHGPMAIFAARFISGVRAATCVLAGMRQVPLRQFLFWNGLAILVTVPIFAATGWVFSTNIGVLQAHVQQANYLLLAFLVVAVGSYVTINVIRWRRRRFRDGDQ
jgi:membrane protein DedA with SNARE-associated domain